MVKGRNKVDSFQFFELGGSCSVVKLLEMQLEYGSLQHYLYNNLMVDISEWGLGGHLCML